MRRIRALVTVLAASGLTAATLAQDRTFRTATDLVSVYATVLDESGRLVPDLTREDFVVKDNGREQPITHFSNGVLPFSVVVMLDRSGSMADHFEVVAEAAQAFVGAMRPGDRARIGHFANEIVMSPDEFTGDREALSDIIETGLQDLGSSPVWTAIDRSMTALLPMPGRQVVLVFTDGHDDPRAGQVRTELEDLIRRTRVNGIMVYAIGFANEVDSPRTSNPWIAPRNPRGPFRLPLPLPVPGRPSPGLGGIRIGKKHQPPDPGLRDLAEESGGGYFELDARDDMRRTFLRVAEELHRQYWIGFAPRSLDGELHEIEVKVRRRGMDVRSRRSYVAPRSDPR